MKLLIIGSGGREHVLAWKLSQSLKVDKIYCAPGNGGTGELAENIPIKADNLQGLLTFAQDNQIDLTVVGPEVPLTEGIVDLFESQHLKIFGPNKAAAQLEGSKLFSKELMQKHYIPTAAYASFDNAEEAKSHLKTCPFPLVIKADGLAAGKGVVIAQTREDAEKAIDNMLTNKVFGHAGDILVIEEFLEGEEASLLAFTDGKTVLPLASAQDHKAVYDSDQGPNTGGMGAYSPAPVLSDDLLAQVQQKILEPTIAALRQEGITYKGILYAGLMITNTGPKVIEFNVRFGDPEAQVVIPRLKNDLLEVMLAVVEERLSRVRLHWHPQHCLSVVLASGGYPGAYEKEKVITGLDQLEDAFVFHAGTVQENGTVKTNGGRVLNVTALGTTLQEAYDTVYTEIPKINFDKVYYRKDIGKKALR